jgi:CRP-like cAMP-binding protein
MTRSLTTVAVIERVLILRQIPLFADLSPADLEAVARIAEEQGYADAETIAQEGELGDEMHVVTEGTIRVVKDLGNDEREIARRSAGDVVGEMSVITRNPRMASLVADGAVRTIRIGHGEFESMLRERPDLAIGVMRVLADRLAESARSGVRA